MLPPVTFTTDTCVSLVAVTAENTGSRKDVNTANLPINQDETVFQLHKLKKMHCVKKNRCVRYYIKKL